MAQVSDYTSLVTSQHSNKPKFMAMVGLVAQTFVDAINLAESIPTQYDIDQANGVQQDAIGQWVGLSRSLKATAPGIYVPAPPSGVVPLGDSDYQILLRGKVGSNVWDGTVSGAFNRLTNIFGNTGSQLFIIDNQDMTQAVGVSGAIPGAGFKAALSGGYMQVRPCGVLSKYYFPTAPGGPLFGFGVDNQFIGGFGHGVWPSST